MKTAAAHLQRLAGDGALRPLDVELGLLMTRLDPEAPPALAVAAAATSLAVSQGHACLPLAALPAVLAEAGAGELPQIDALADPVALASLLRASPLVAAGHADAMRPLLLDVEDRLYLRRYFRFEQQVADALRARAVPRAKAPDADALRKLLAQHFVLDGSVDWQAVAVLTGLLSQLVVITGGPGTGKTTTVIGMLAARVTEALQRGDEPPRIALAAPTGKAAMRLGEVLRQRLPGLPVDDAVRTALPDSASTLHRLLGSRPGSHRFRHHAGNPLPLDLLVVDEASMVDLPLMARLLDALPDAAQLVLLGDRDQLASVEAGNVLAAIAAAGEGPAVGPRRAALIQSVCGFQVPAAETTGAFADVVVELKDSHRFGADSGLGRLAAAVRAGQGEAVSHALAAGDYPGVHLETSADPATAVVGHAAEFFAELADQDDPAAALAAAGKQRVLTALRDGPAGCVALNDAIEQRLRQHVGAAAGASWYRGRLLLILENDYDSGLYNGDVGIVLPAPGGGLMAWFAAADGSVRAMPRSLLPAHESAFAMTIHKSQGSEFDQVGIVLPPVEARVLGRELLYTAITRARRSVWLLATPEILEATIARSTRRHGGLRARLQA